ncbi:MAG: SdiA-regulated domain-containing protein [Deltaproteobacteria bacterium]|jgi:uncharacterized protein YjiK|nr:SdiA-regulated domain-containing protein [Deltaproteobacteria bacterium]
MSLKALDAVIAKLPGRIGPEQVDALATALGKRVGNAELGRLRELLDGGYQRCSKAGLVALEMLAQKPAPDRAQVTFKVDGEFSTGVREQSAMCFLSERHGFAVIDDESSVVWRVPLPKKKEELAAQALRENDGHLKGLEALAHDEEAKVLLTLSEDNRTIHELPVELEGPRVELGEPRALGKLPDLTRRKNKGWEGLTVVPAALAPDHRPRLLAVQEGLPPLVCIFHRDTLALEAKLELPAEAIKFLPDVSDVAFDPKTNHLFLLSDEGNAIYECILASRSRARGGQLLTEWGLIPLGETLLPELPGKVERQAEGLTFDHRGDLFVAGEGETSLLRLRRE